MSGPKLADAPGFLLEGTAARRRSHRIRKVYVHGQYVDERIYVGGFEIWRRHESGSLKDERETLHVADDARRVCMIETLTLEGGSAPGTITPRFRFQLDNHLGTCGVETDDAGAVISYEEYHPYGTSAYRAMKSGVEVSARRYRYTGKERDDETGLYLMGARYYACWLARWTAADPAGTVDGTNLYAYVRGSPVGLVDPSGTQGIGISDDTIREWAEEFAAVATRNLPYLRGEISGPPEPLPTLQEFAAARGQHLPPTVPPEAPTTKLSGLFQPSTAGGGFDPTAGAAGAGGGISDAEQAFHQQKELIASFSGSGDGPSGAAGLGVLALGGETVAAEGGTGASLGLGVLATGAIVVGGTVLVIGTATSNPYPAGYTGEGAGVDYPPIALKKDDDSDGYTFLWKAPGPRVGDITNFPDAPHPTRNPALEVTVGFDPEHYPGMGPFFGVDEGGLVIASGFSAVYGLGLQQFSIATKDYDALVSSGVIKSDPYYGVPGVSVHVPPEGLPAFNQAILSGPPNVYYPP